MDNQDSLKTQTPGYDPINLRYFVMKCDVLKRLNVAKDTSVWACTDRQYAPQPKYVLTEAFTQGPVILIFSVSNCHGWHGIATMETAPGCVGDVSTDHKSTESKTLKCERAPNEDPVSVIADQSCESKWHKFRIKWQTLFLWEHGEQCCPHSKTGSLQISDGAALNKARNMQELPSDIGEILCKEIREHYQRLSEIKLHKEEDKLKKLGEPFFDPGLETDQAKIWEKLISKVETIGTVLLACIFGSQRYNLHNQDSDVDMFIVYRAPTTEFLGFRTPQQTIKNRDTETCDYTVHEVRRYCELLISGDHRCVETLFLHPTSIYRQTDQWLHLVSSRQTFLTRNCLDKYLSDATGGKGVKLLDKWVKSGVATTSPMPGKVAKLFYIILRLLHNAREVANGQLEVYRAEGSQQRELLVRVRQGECDYITLRHEVDSLLENISRARSEMGDTATQDMLLHKNVEQWLIELRTTDLTMKVI